MNRRDWLRHMKHAQFGSEMSRQFTRFVQRFIREVAEIGRAENLLKDNIFLASCFWSRWHRCLPEHALSRRFGLLGALRQRPIMPGQNGAVRHLHDFSVTEPNVR